MLKISNRNTIRPNKVRLSDWGFTTVEGGRITYFTFPNSESAYRRMCYHVEDRDNWYRYPNKHPEGRGSREYTRITIVPEFDIIKAHSVFFPDGRIFDSTIRGYRKIRDYELQRN